MRHLPFTSKNYSTVVSSAACLHLLYALPNGEYFECDQDPLPWREGLLKRPAFQIEDGLAMPSDAPGLGLDLDETALRPWLVTP
jgi:D-arabinonate dehydratase/D-galactarolactone cycloisomerase